MDLFGETTNNWGGKRPNAGRPKIQEKRRILMLQKVIYGIIEREKPFLTIPPKKRGAHQKSCEIVEELMPLLPQE